MAHYVKSAQVYKCPSDFYQSGANPGERVRSISMNGALNQKPTFINQTGRKYFYRKKNGRSAKRQDRPACFVFLDEHADSIDDGCFMVNPGYAPGEERWRNFTGEFIMTGWGIFHSPTAMSRRTGGLEKEGNNTTIYRVRVEGMPSAQPWNTISGGFTSRDYEWITDRLPYH